MVRRQRRLPSPESEKTELVSRCQDSRSIDEITDPSLTTQGDFAQGALVQETINAFEESFRRRAWVDFPLNAPAIAAAS